MKTYKFRVNTNYGPRIIVAQTAAKTRTGVLRALGVAVARQCHTDIMEVTGGGCLLYMDGVSKNHPINAFRRAQNITKGEEHYIWQACHDEMAEILYA